MKTEYERHAKRLDSRFTSRPPPGSPPGTPAPTPILDRLRSFTRVRALVLGGYGEASVDVHHLLDVCADRIAAANWQYQGARTMVEYRGYIINRLRRRLSLIVARAYTRYILRRLAMVGVPNPGAVRAPQPMPVPRQTGLEAEFFAAQVWEAPPDDLW